MTSIRKLHDKWMKEPEYRAEYDALEQKFAISSALIKARSDAGLTQAELAKRMNTTQSVIARMEAGKVNPSTSTLQKFAKATGMRMKISFEPVS